MLTKFLRDVEALVLLLMHAFTRQYCIPIRNGRAKSEDSHFKIYKKSPKLISYYSNIPCLTKLKIWWCSVPCVNYFATLACDLQKLKWGVNWGNCGWCESHESVTDRQRELRVRCRLTTVFVRSFHQGWQLTVGSLSTCLQPSPALRPRHGPVRVPSNPGACTVCL